MDDRVAAKRTGRVFLWVGGVGALVGLCCCGGYAVTVGGALFGMRGTVSQAMKASFAPGTGAMRAIGCDTAMAIDFGDFTDAIVQDLDRLGVEPPPAPSEEAILLLCQPSLGGTPPEPAHVARVYVEEVHPTSELTVMVQDALGRQRTQRFSAEGVALGPSGPTPADTRGPAE